MTPGTGLKLLFCYPDLCSIRQRIYPCYRIRVEGFVEPLSRRSEEAARRGYPTASEVSSGLR